MPNHLRFVNPSRAAELYLSVDTAAFDSLEIALDYIVKNPLPDGRRIAMVDHPPVVLYHYRDDNWRIAYSLSYFREGDYYSISVVAVFPVPIA